MDSALKNWKIYKNLNSQEVDLYWYLFNVCWRELFVILTNILQIRMNREFLIFSLARAVVVKFDSSQILKSPYWNFNIIFFVFLSVKQKIIKTFYSIKEN